MRPPRRRGRRVPPRGPGPRPAPQPLAGPAPAAGSDGSTVGSGADADIGGADAAAERARLLTRAQNRAAKRAASGVRPKAVRGGRVTGRSSRGYNPAIIGLAIAAVLVGAAVFLIGNPFGAASPSGSPEGSPEGSATPIPSRSLTACPTSAPTSLAAGEARTVTIETSKGDIVIDVEASLAPVAAVNFVALASCGYYDGVIFHRVVPDFVIQGGDGQYGWIGALDRSKVGQGGPGYQFADEPVIGDYTRGTVAMANSGADTNGSQFFICTADLTSLPKSYTIFGHVTSGMDVVDQIVAAPRDANDLPNDPVAMTHVTVSAAAAPSASPSAAPATSPGESAAP